MQWIGWPQSFVGKTMAICFVGTHVPLIALVVWLAAQGRLGDDLPVLVLVLVATLVGTAGALLALYGMLAPILRTTAALEAYGRARVPPSLPTIYDDAAGQLMQSVQSTILQLDRTIVTLESLSVTDPLTGLYNRRWLDDVGERSVVDARRNARPLSLLWIDVDHFKAFNDNHGHSIGDQVLILVADAIREGVRASGQGVRVGGDEFCVFMADADQETAEAAARRIRLAIELGVNNFLRLANVTLSIGVATLGPDDTTFTDLQKRADENLFNAKRAGRDQASAG